MISSQEMKIDVLKARQWARPRFKIKSVVCAQDSLIDTDLRMARYDSLCS